MPRADHGRPRPCERLSRSDWMERSGSLPWRLLRETLNELWDALQKGDNPQIYEEIRDRLED